MSNRSIWPIDKTLSGATTLGQRGSGSDGNEEALCIPQSSSVSEASPSDCLVSYPGHSLGESYLFAEMQSAYSTAQADWANMIKDRICFSCKTMILSDNREDIWTVYRK